MLLDIDPAYLKYCFLKPGTIQLMKLPNNLVLKKKIFSNPAFIIASGWLHTDGEEIIKGIEDGFGSEVTVFGGMAGDDLTLRAPIVFT